MKILSSLLVVLFFSTTLHAQDAAKNWTVQLTATVNDDPASITLTWEPNANPIPTTYAIFRKIKGTNGWGTSIGTVPAAGTLAFTDVTAIEGVSYEYYVQLRLGGTIYGWGNINSGINVQLSPNKGDLLLLVDQTFAIGLEDEIAILENDLYTDGWMVTTVLIDPLSTASAVKSTIIDNYTNLPNLKALYLLGHIPVPYSGELYPDAHDNHVGAWPADVYYADIDGNWTDETVNNITASSTRNHNIPGDGKFDQSRIPSHVELQISRVDMHDLPAFGPTEEELLRAYLDKAHEFKIANYVPTERGLVDQGGFAGMPEGFAQNGFRNFIGFFGKDNVYELDYWTTLNGSDYLWSYGCGAGSYTSAGDLNGGGSLTTTDMASGYSESTFTMLFGSYFGDWDMSNNLMRASIANGRTLTCSWAARPNWYYHTLAMGENIGYSILQSQDIESDYLSLTLGDGTFVTGEGVHVSQLGDPSLRMYYLAPPSDLTILNQGSSTLISWTASSDETIDGYNVYRRKVDELWVKINDEIIDSLSLNDFGIDDAGDYDFMVKSVKLKTNASGTFYNESLGATEMTSFYASINDHSVTDFAIYPNPNQGQFSIRSNQIIESISITNSSGAVVFIDQPHQQNLSIELPDLAKGIYFVLLTANGKQSVERIVIF